MKQILIIGAGRSATTLIEYLLNVCELENWKLLLGDLNLDLAQEKIGESIAAEAFRFDAHDEANTDSWVAKADIVISMLPARFHALLARPCLKHKKHFLTASYVSDEIREMDAEAREKGLLFLMECGLDPGIDHMSAMRVMDDIRAKNYELKGFETFTGGLIAPESTLDNPWEYKFTWNPRNVVLAGQGIVKFIQEGRYKYFPYHRLFRRTEMLHVPEYGYFEGYANRDSLKYLDVYKLRGINTLYRGTLRRPGFCKAWDIFVQLGATDDQYEMEGVDKMTHRQFINSFLSYDPHNSVELKLAHYMGLDLEGEEMFKLKWLGLFNEDLIGLEKGTPAQILEHILKKSWKLDEEDKDMIVMLHLFDFIGEGRARRIQSHMVVKGDDTIQTAMAKTVGYPLGIAAKLLLTAKMQATGVQIPVIPEIYNPILDELSGLGIDFVEREIERDVV
ncbi:MAG: saccharopine dehydrogenase C-terminal domain-containing protein [Bacteroidota bacterium]